MLINSAVKRIMNPQLEDSTIADALTTFQQLIAARDYDAALQQWQSLRGQVDDYTYWLNLGSLQTLRAKLPEARYALEMARHATVYSSSLERSLAQVKSQLEEEPGYGVEHSTPVTDAILFLGPAKFAFIGALGILVLLVRMKRLKSISSFVLLVASLIPVGIAGYLQYRTQAFVTLRVQKVYEAPSRAFPTSRAILPGHRLLAVDAHDWLRVHGADGEVVWLAKDEASAGLGVLWGASK